MGLKKDKSLLSDKTLNKLLKKAAKKNAKDSDKLALKTYIESL